MRGAVRVGFLRLWVFLKDLCWARLCSPFSSMTFCDALSNSKHMLFADDLQIYLSCPPAEILQGLRLISQDVHAIFEYAGANGLKLNLEKSKIIIFSSRAYASSIDVSRLPPVTVGMTSLPFVSEDLRPCEDDNDCSPNSYCYKISKYCTNFTTCAWYNRLENLVPARRASQCGPCITGYATEILTDGTERDFCRRIVVTDGEQYQGSMMIRQDFVIYMIISIAVFIFLSIIFYVKFHKVKQWYEKIEFNCFRRNNVTNTDAATANATNNNSVTIATAPPEEQTSFIKIVEDESVHGKNRQPIDINGYQKARPFVPPSWVTINSPHSGNDHANVPNIVTAQSQNDIPANWPLMPRPTVELPEVNIEQQDNNMNINIYNTIVRQRSSDSDTNSTTESNKTSDNEEKRNENNEKKKNEERETSININQTFQMCTSIKVET
ncbi:uncharacterized protein LOC105835169 isoform X1 [Monomorium pharaonis]|uniref:uncharacterized protein LOC105835169 isoform X1 n=1 Tax=Monomorium pharaonis TaxID=307658 RepID=UPI001747877F|nr:uncharacterized protein LOC105835169 isoform X1 [Monomorium pharaonis]